MAEFMVRHRHKPEECEQIFQALQNKAASLKGSDFFCTCPSGDHGGFFSVDAASAEDARQLFPEDLRGSVEVFTGETMTLL